MTFPAKPKAGWTGVVDASDERMLIVGLDTQDGPSHPLYDERIHTLSPEEQELDEDGTPVVDDAGQPVMRGSHLSRSIARFGVRAPILLRAVTDPALGTVYHVLDGRQRLRCARWVADATGAARQVPVIISEVKGEDVVAQQLSIVLNEARTDDDPVTRAEKAHRLQSTGVPLEEVAEIFGVSKNSVYRMIRFIAGSAETDPAGPKLKEAVRAGVIPWSRGWQLLGKQEDGTRLPSDEVEAIAAKALAGHAEKGSPKVTNNGKKGRNSGQTAGYVKVGSLKAWTKKAPGAFAALPADIQLTINWILNPQGVALPDNHPLNVLMLAGERAAAAKGEKVGRKAQAPGSVEKKENKAGEVYWRAVNKESVPGNFATEAEARAFAASKAPPPKKKKAEAAPATPSPTAAHAAEQAAKLNAAVAQAVAAANGADDEDADALAAFAAAFDADDGDDLSDEGDEGDEDDLGDEDEGDEWGDDEDEDEDGDEDGDGEE